jgi:hypothetical protein
LIEKKTVFVLGAGAHCSYGFPSGRDLKEQVVSVIRNAPDFLDGLSELQSTLRISEVDIAPAVIRDFALAMENSGQASIDAFLNANRHRFEFETIGKAAISRVLLEQEIKSETDQRDDDDWLGYVFEIMIDGVDNPRDFVDKNQVAFVTFNYDRFLERWLLKKIQHSFGIDRRTALAHLKLIPIHHVYGSLGSIVTDQAVPAKAWMHAWQSIRTIFDAERFDDEINAAKELLRSAQVVCLLGYGFHRENTQLLSLTDCLARDGCSVVSSRFELQELEWLRLTKPFMDAGVHIENTQSHRKCREALRYLPVF